LISNLIRTQQDERSQRKVIFVPKIGIWAGQYAAAEETVITIENWKHMSLFRQEASDDQILHLHPVCFKTISKSTLTKSRFGYVTNTKIKFIIVVESSNTLLRDNEVRTVSVFIKRMDNCDIVVREMSLDGLISYIT
jgi:hypothetical protein